RARERDVVAARGRGAVRGREVDGDALRAGRGQADREGGGHHARVALGHGHVVDREVGQGRGRVVVRDRAEALAVPDRRVHGGREVDEEGVGRLVGWVESGGHRDRLRRRPLRGRQDGAGGEGVATRQGRARRTDG